ncbi:Myb-like DNA-binding domain-containing protein [Paenibacillus elgii]|uniref:Myb-like DNA-binding domain-containing protein n=1 Tax=Paenibacillus elgii TaxID=189691 RepID=UPI000248D921|nr:Myb-like DNA-binding domain-containing protein [Paenibacillus elgii]
MERKMVKRNDYFCLDCEELFSVYQKGNNHLKRKYCPFCADDVSVEPYNINKHGAEHGIYFKSWSRADITLLKALMQEGGTWKEIAASLGRTIDSVRHYAKTLNLTRSTKEPYIYWSESESEKLRELLDKGSSSWEEMAAEIGRPQQAVKSHAKRKGWKKAR